MMKWCIEVWKPVNPIETWSLVTRRTLVADLSNLSERFKGLLVKSITLVQTELSPEGSEIIYTFMYSPQEMSCNEPGDPLTSSSSSTVQRNTFLLLTVISGRLWDGLLWHLYRHSRSPAADPRHREQHHPLCVMSPQRVDGSPWPLLKTFMPFYPFADPNR